MGEWVNDPYPTGLYPVFLVFFFNMGDVIFVVATSKQVHFLTDGPL